MKFLFNKFCLGLIVALFSFSASSQTFPWARSADGNGIDEGIAICNDATGNVLLTGQFTSSLLTFGTLTLSNTSGSCVFLAKYDANGNPVWVRKAISTGYDYGNSVSCDPAGNIFISGYFASPTLVFGTYTLTNNGNYDIFIVKYDPSGNVLWAGSAGDAGNDYGYSVHADASGNAFVAGSFSSPTITFGANTLTNNGVCDSYLVKYSSSGTALWATNPTGTGGDENWSVCTDANGNAYTVGDFVSSTLTFGNYTVTNTGACPLYLAKYDPSGNVLWVKSAGGTGYDYCNYVTVDNGGNPIITGDFSSPTIAFGTTTLTNKGNSDAYIAKYDPQGNPLWALSGGTLAYEKGYSLSADANSIYCTGNFSNSIVFGTHTLTAPPNAPDPVYILALDYSGNIQCASSLNSGGDDQQGISADKLGHAYFTSDFIGTLPVGSTTLNPTGTENIFIAKYVCIDVTGLKEQEKSSASIYPNPSSGSFKILLDESAGDCEMIITDVTGKQVMEIALSHGLNNISKEQFQKGIYFYRILNKQRETIVSGKLITE
jgi:hypothetical protein